MIKIVYSRHRDLRGGNFYHTELDCPIRANLEADGNALYKETRATPSGDVTVSSGGVTTWTAKKCFTCQLSENLRGR